MQPQLENGLTRPLLDTPRSMLEDYARNHQLIWREDRTNAQTNYRRNYIRQHISPHFTELQTDAYQRLATTFTRLRAEALLFEAGLHQMWENAQTAPSVINRKHLPANPAVALRLLHHQLRAYGFKGDQFRQMLEAGSGTTIIGESAKIVVKKELLYLEIR